MSERSKSISDTLKPVLIDTISAQAYGALIALPGFGFVFGLPVISSVAKYIIRDVISWAVQNTAVGLSLLWIIVDLAYEVNTAEEAKVRLKAMLDDPSKYSLEEQQKLEEHFDETSLDLIQLSIKRL